MLPEDREFVSELNNKVAKYCQYIANANQFEKTQLLDVLDEIQKSTKKIKESYSRYEKAQLEFRPQVPFQCLVDELQFCEQGLKSVLAESNRLTPRYR